VKIAGYFTTLVVYLCYAVLTPTFVSAAIFHGGKGSTILHAALFSSILSTMATAWLFRAISKLPRGQD